MLRPGDVRTQGGGNLNQPVNFYTMVQTQDAAGGVVRTKQLAYDAMAGIGPYESVELRDALRELGETWAVFHIRYHEGRVPTEGMHVVILLTGEEFEVRGVKHLEFVRKVVECTCRMVR